MPSSSDSLMMPTGWFSLVALSMRMWRSTSSISPIVPENISPLIGHVMAVFVHNIFVQKRTEKGLKTYRKNGKWGYRNL